MKSFDYRRLIVPTAAGVALLIATGVWYAVQSGQHLATLTSTQTPSKVTIAIPKQVAAASILIAQDRGFFSATGVDTTLKAFDLGRDALQSLLQGDADLAVMADTPFMLAAINGEEIAAIATVFSSRKTLALVGRKDRGVHDLNSLKGKKVGTVFGINAQFFLYALILSSGLNETEIEVINFKPFELSDALKNGKVDAITAWNPELARLESQISENYSVIYGKELFVSRYILVGKRAYLDTHQAEVKKVLTALQQSVQFIQEHSAQAEALVGKSISLEPALLARIFDPKDYFLTLDQTLLLSLSEQSRWAVKSGIVKSKTTPNYLEFIHPRALEQVSPTAVKIIR